MKVVSDLFFFTRFFFSFFLFFFFFFFVDSVCASAQIRTVDKGVGGLEADVRHDEAVGARVELDVQVRTRGQHEGSRVFPRARHIRT